MWSRADSSVPQIKEFLRLLMTEMKRRGKNVRGPYLAWLELYKLVDEKGLDADETVGMFQVRGLIKFFITVADCLNYSQGNGFPLSCLFVTLFVSNLWANFVAFSQNKTREESKDKGIH